MIRALALVLMLACTGVAKADDFEHQRIEALSAHTADLASTGVGLAMGAVEANPLGLLLIPVKVISYYKIKESPKADQPAMWAAYEALGWGATANNACVIAAIASGGPASVPCLAVGAVAAGVSWMIDSPRRRRMEFDVVCEQARLSNPEMECIWADAN